MELGAFFGRFVWRGINMYDVIIHPSRGSRINPHWRCGNTTGPHTLQWYLIRDTSLRSWDGWRASHGKRRKEEIKKTKVQRTQAQWSMTCTSSDLAGLLISIGKIVQRDESGKSSDFEEGKWCSSHASATATCEQRRPKQGEGKDQTSDTYKWLPCTLM